MVETCFLYTGVMSANFHFCGNFSFKISSWFQIAVRNELHISEVTLRHFAGMFSKVPTLEEFKLPIDVSTSALSTPEKWKVDDSFAYIFHDRMIFIISYSVIYKIAMRIIRNIRTVTSSRSFTMSWKKLLKILHSFTLSEITLSLSTRVILIIFAPLSCKIYNWFVPPYHNFLCLVVHCFFQMTLMFSNTTANGSKRVVKISEPK